MKRAMVLVGLALLGSCAPPAPARPGRTLPPQAIQPAPARYDTPTPYVTPKPSSQPPPPATAADACGAAAHAYLVGKNRSEIPVPVDPSLRRVSCSSCPVTMDFNPRRLNILYDQGSGVITQVKCG
jgi:hypothetical protein